MANKALELLKKAKSVDERAGKYAERIATSLRIKMILPLQEKVEAMEDKIFDLENFSLDTNLNKGQKTMTKEDCEKRFEEIIVLKYQKAMLELELEAKQESFNELFGSEEAE